MTQETTEIIYDSIELGRGYLGILLMIYILVSLGILLMTYILVSNGRPL